MRDAKNDSYLNADSKYVKFDEGLYNYSYLISKYKSKTIKPLDMNQLFEVPDGYKVENAQLLPPSVEVVKFIGVTFTANADAEKREFSDLKSLLNFTKESNAYSFVELSEDKLGFRILDIDSSQKKITVNWCFKHYDWVIYFNSKKDIVLRDPLFLKESSKLLPNNWSPTSLLYKELDFYVASAVLFDEIKHHRLLFQKIL